MARLKVSPGGLYALLNSELTRRRVTGCLCQMPLPYQVTRPDEVSANWRIGTATTCPHKCDVLIAEILTDFWTKYDLLDTATEKPTEAEPG